MDASVRAMIMQQSESRRRWESSCVRKHSTSCRPGQCWWACDMFSDFAARQPLSHRKTWHLAFVPLCFPIQITPGAAANRSTALCQHQISLPHHNPAEDSVILKQPLQSPWQMMPNARRMRPSDLLHLTNSPAKRFLWTQICHTSHMPCAA